MVRMAMSRIGTTTGQGLAASPMRFSLIIRPQSAAGGCWPNPRKLRPAMRAME
jgi:hypothetical protein